jgi:spore coat protein U-like protein
VIDVSPMVGDDCCCQKNLKFGSNFKIIDDHDKIIQLYGVVLLQCTFIDIYTVLLRSATTMSSRRMLSITSR